MRYRGGRGVVPLAGIRPIQMPHRWLDYCYLVSVSVVAPTVGTVPHRFLQWFDL